MDTVSDGTNLAATPNTYNNSISNSSARKLPFEFRGDGMEYFKIWIVNIFLTVLTLGIYSAWATVRSNRYFYSNLYLEDVNFRYLANPITILKGRLIAIAALIAYIVASSLIPMLGIALLITLLVAMPYLVNQSMAFKMRMSAYKNIQFRFKASYGEACMVLFVWPILGIITLGILYPLAFLKMNQYVVRNSAYGTTKFNFTATYKDYGVVFLIMLGVGLVCSLFIWLINTFMPVLSPVSMLIIVLMYFGMIVYFIVSMNTIFYSHLNIAEHSFATTINMMDLAKVILINIGLVIVTFGLYLPAAKVRMTKYLASTISLNAVGSLDHFVAAEQENISALGEEFGNVFDFGV